MTFVIQREVQANQRSESRSTLNKYRITDRMYNRVIHSEPEVLVKVKSYESEKKLDLTVCFEWMKNVQDLCYSKSLTAQKFVNM